MNARVSTPKASIPRTRGKARGSPAVIGVGINATDTIIRLPHFPAADSKVGILSVDVRPGGQVASAMVACRRWGLRARYVGKVGDDAAGKFQIREMDHEGVEAHWITAAGCDSQSAFILVDDETGERTVLWRRDARIALHPEDLRQTWVRGARALLVDGHDTQAATRAARWAHELRIPVVADLDNRYPGVHDLLEHTDFAVTSREFPARFTGEKNLLKALPLISRNFKCRLTAATLGYHGVIAWDGFQFHFCRGYRANVVDTTGAGDIFHGAFVYALVRGWQMKDILDFSCAAAALSCEGIGARGGIPSLARIRKLRMGARRTVRLYSRKALFAAAEAARHAAEVRS